MTRARRSEPGWPPADHPGATYPRPAPRRRAAPHHAQRSRPQHRTGEWRTIRDHDAPPAPPGVPHPRADASHWNWLLIIPIALPLMPGLYNRIEPTLFGIPFFYWCQLGFAFLASAVITVVHRKVR